MLAIINNFFKARYITYEASKLCEYEFSILPFFLFPPLQHLLNHTSTITSTWMLIKVKSNFQVLLIPNYHYISVPDQVTQFSG